MAEENVVTPEDARAYLNTYAPNEDVLSGMSDDDVIAYHTRVAEAEVKLSKEAGEKALAARIPEKYELKLPDDSLLPESDIDKISSIAREKGLSNEEAQLVLEQRNDAANALRDSQFEQMREMQTKWQSEVKADPDMGGDNLGETQRLAKLVTDNAMTDGMREFLSVTGYSDNPEVMRFLVKVGKMMDEDKPSGEGAPNKGGDKDAASVLYDNTKE